MLEAQSIRTSLDVLAVVQVELLLLERSRLLLERRLQLQFVGGQHGVVELNKVVLVTPLPVVGWTSLAVWLAVAVFGFGWPQNK